MKVIEVENLAFSLKGASGDAAILKGLSFSVAAGEYISVIGPNGAGKSTLLKCLVGVNSAWSGSVRINGGPVNRYTRRELARFISYVPQTNDHLVPFTVKEFVSMGRYPYLGPFSALGKEDRNAVGNALEVTGMKEFAARGISTLSGGERQKALIAGALAQAADIMLLDEPTTFLDPKQRHEIVRILKRINREEGTTVVAVTHDINTAALFSNGILALKEGRVAFNGTPERVMNNATLMSIFEKPFTFAVHPETGGAVVVPEAE